MNDLKNCPFCGGEVRMYWTRKYQVSCTVCNIWLSSEGTNEAAIEAWNARPEEDRLKAQNAELLEALEGFLNHPLQQTHSVGLFEETEIASKAIAAARERR